MIHPEEGLQSVTTFKSSLGLTDTQVLKELPRFLGREPRKWFSVLRTHIATWAEFCELFRTVFLPAEDKECVWRGILDRVQHPQEPLPTFAAHMLREFKWLRNPPSEQEQIELIFKHAQEKYRVALCGARVTSVIELYLQAHVIHSVLGPNTTQLPRPQVKSKADGGPYCFKCSMPGFTSHYTLCGLFQFKVLPFGLCNAPATFQRLMNNVLAGLIYKSCAVYLDDIVVASPTFEQHLADLKEILDRLQSAGLTLKLSKCQFCLSDLTFLGYRVSPSGIHRNPDKLRAVMDFLTSVKHVRQFLGLTGYYRRFVQDYARHAEPLFALTKKDLPFNWDNKVKQP